MNECNCGEHTMKPAVKSAVKAIAKRINYLGSIYEDLLKIRRTKGAYEAAFYLKRVVLDLSEQDIKRDNKTNKYHYKMTLALFDLLDWEEVLQYVFDYDIEAEESRKSGHSYHFIFKPY